MRYDAPPRRIARRTVCRAATAAVSQAGRAITVLPTSRVGARVRFAGCKQVQASTSKLPFAIETACCVGCLCWCRQQMLIFAVAKL